MAELSTALLQFCEHLRTEHNFSIGHPEASDALSALQAVGIDDPQRVHYALRAVCCSRFEQFEAFDRLFDAFFANFDPGVRQPRPPQPSAGEEGEQSPPFSRREVEHDSNATQSTLAMRAKYSPSATNDAASPVVGDAGLAETLTDAARLISALHLGRSRRWKAHVKGPRLDIRRTLRSSLQTGGDPLRLRTFGHPPRNPRIVLLIDASRSMSEHAPGLLQFGYALCRRSRRASVFVFSTGLDEITRELRSLPLAGDRQLSLFGEAWGGGTRIGSALADFTRTFSARLDKDTLVIIASDGLDAGEISKLRHVMRRLHRRTAGVMWLNPHASTPGFSPAARGMQAALPYVSVLLDAKDLKSLGAAARRLRR